MDDEQKRTELWARAESVRALLDVASAALRQDWEHAIGALRTNDRLAALFAMRLRELLDFIAVQYGAKLRATRPLEGAPPPRGVGRVPIVAKKRGESYELIGKPGPSVSAVPRLDGGHLDLAREGSVVVQRPGRPGEGRTARGVAPAAARGRRRTTEELLTEDTAVTLPPRPTNRRR